MCFNCFDFYSSSGIKNQNSHENNIVIDEPGKMIESFGLLQGQFKKSKNQ